jgi:hypothetical protein
MKRLLLIMMLFILVPLQGYAFSARVETVDGEILTLDDFSMEGRRTFSIDEMGGIGRLDWKEIAAFEIKQVGQRYWVEVQYGNGKKETFSLRHYSSFRGRADSGPVSLPFQKVKRVALSPDAPEGKKTEEMAIKVSDLLSSALKEVDKITLRNGDVLLGNISNEIVSIRTLYGTLAFKKEDIQRVLLGSSGKGQKEKESDTLHSKYGDKLTGSISESQIKITLLTKTNLSISREHIREIEFGVAVDNEQRAIREKPFEPVLPPKTD